MTCLRRSILFLGVVILFLMLQPSRCPAMDPRFEIDPAQVQKKTGGTVKQNRENGRSKTYRAERKSRNSHTRNGRGAVQDQLVSRFHLASGSAVVSEPDMLQIRAFWVKLMPSGGVVLPPLAFKSAVFDLSVDPERYPLLRAFDGGKVLLDTSRTLPPLVKSLIQEYDPSIRIVTASPSDGHRFLGELLTSGGFYSVEEQPQLVFGDDPQLKMRSDFKVERTAESVMNNQVLLVSASTQSVPEPVVKYAKDQGFELVEPFAERTFAPVPLRHRVIRVTPHDQTKIVDTVLDTLAVPAERNRRVELFGAAQSGISLSVTAERYFEHAGKRYVVTRFTGDPVAYTLFRLLETKGYRVVILQPGDSFKTTAGKLLASMSLSTSYRSHLLLADPAGKYSLAMSGFLLENTLPGGGTVMLTDRFMERNLRGLLSDHGYQVQEQ